MSNAYPPVIGLKQLAELLQKKPWTVAADRSRAPHRLPPACTPPDTKQPLWLLDDVIAWLAQHREPASQSPQAAAPRRRGRPTKAEEIARRAEREGGAA